jgi:hypothetical protein
MVPADQLSPTGKWRELQTRLPQIQTVSTLMLPKVRKLFPSLTKPATVAKIGMVCLIMTMGYGETSPDQTGRPLAGRKFRLGDPLPTPLINLLSTQLAIPSSTWKVGVCLFTRLDQPFSARLVSELEALYPETFQDSIPVWEIACGSPPTARDTVLRKWPLIADPDFALYDAFGLRVQPSIFLITNDWHIVDYLPGYSPAAIRNLKESLGYYYPSLFPPKTPLIFQVEEKRQERRENLARKLYHKRQYELAKAQLMALDSLSPTGHFLLGMVYFQQQDYQAARKQFTALLSHPDMQNYAHFGLGITTFYLDHLDSAWYHLNRVRTIPDMYQVHYWKGRVLENLGQKDRALSEYRKGYQQIFQKTGLTAFPK